MAERVSEGRTVILDAQGSGTVTLGPAGSVRGWRITRMTTYGTSAVVPVLAVRRGSGGPVVDTTRFGNSDVSETSLNVLPGESLTVTYTGGSSGAAMSIYLEGEVLA